MADLDSGEFNFDTVPALGGPEALDQYQSLQVANLDMVIEQLSEQITNRQHQLTVLEQLLMNRNLAAEVYLQGVRLKRDGYRLCTVCVQVLLPENDSFTKGLILPVKRVAK
eukprot:UN30931